jgi:hypothetical protein
MIRLHLARAYSALGRKKEADQEVAAVKVPKGKEQILAPPGEKTKVGSRRGLPNHDPWHRVPAPGLSPAAFWASALPSGASEDRG